MTKTIKNQFLFCLSLSISLSGAPLNLAQGAEATNFVSQSEKLSHEDYEAIARSITAEGVLDENVFSGVTLPTPIAEENIVPMTKEEILIDKGARITDDFSIPKGLEKRVSFWFDVYTKYSDKNHVIHHVLYPWIVFKVVDTSPIYASNLHKWTKYHKAKKVVSQEVANVRLALRKLSKRKSFKNLKGLEKEIFTALAEVKGPRQNVMREAAKNMRVQLGQRDFFLSGLTSSAKYLPYMEQEFKAVGLPVELARLPFVESSFNEKAHSKVGASGIWQIMPVTGRAYFKVNELIDERNSPLKASLAAADIFKTNYKQLKDWPLAVTAYNHGVAGLKGNLKKARATNLPDLIRKYHAGSFKFASANFYTCFLAVVHAERYHQEIFNKSEIIREEPMLHHVFALKSPIRVNKVIQMTGLNKEAFLTYNMDLKNAAQKNIKLPVGFKILLPPSAKRNLEANLGPSLMIEAENMSLSKPKRRG
jgi:membrane-bound lytic murein transglycosylase D